MEDAIFKLGVMIAIGMIAIAIGISAVAMELRRISVIMADRLRVAERLHHDVTNRGNDDYSDSDFNSTGDVG